MEKIIKRIILLCLLSMPAQAQLQVTVNARPQAAIDDPLQRRIDIAAIPGNVAIKDEEEWSNQRAATIKEVTDYFPGVIAQPRNGAESARLSVRGSGLANIFQGRGLLVMQDGIPINTADGGFEFASIDPWLIRSAESYPGANALEYGASNFGGALNFLTPTGQTAGGYRVRAEGGSFGTLHGQLSAGQVWKDGDSFASATGFSQNGFRDHNQQDTRRFNANVGVQVNEKISNRVYFSHTHSDAEIPGAISLNEIDRNPHLANPANIAGDYRRNLDITRIVDKTAWVDGRDRIDTAVFYTHRTLDNPVTTYEYQTDHDVGLRSKYTRTNEQDNWQLGFNAYYGIADEIRYRNVGGNVGALILTRDLNAFTGEAYTQYQRRLTGGLYGIAGVQASYATRGIEQAFPTSAEQNTHYTGFSPHVGLRYEFDARNQLFANVSRSFEPPSFGEISGGNNPGFNQLKAQRASTAELGARGLYGGMEWQAAYYHGWLTNEFVNYRFADGSTDTINARRTTRDGIELGLSGDVAKSLWETDDAISVRAAYSYSRFNLDNDSLYGDNALPGVPKHYLRAETLYRHPSGISIGPNIEWAPSDAPVDLTNSFFAEGYAIVGVRAFWESEDKGLNIYLEGRNLADKTHIATSNVVPDAGGADGRYFFPGEGRSVYAGMAWKW